MTTEDIGVVEQASLGRRVDAAGRGEGTNFVSATGDAAGSSADTRAVRAAQQAFGTIGIAQLHDVAGDYATVLSELGTVPRTRVNKFCGPAYPVLIDGGGLPIMQAIAAAPPGSVIVIDDVGPEPVGLIGDILVAAAITRELSAFVVRGAIRDSDELFEMGLPIRSSAVCCVKGPLGHPTDALPATLHLSTGPLAPGDWIFADGDGLLAIDRRKVRAVMIAARMVHAGEARLRRRLGAGEPFAEVVGLDALVDGCRELD